jgi:hypothetical protein
MADLAPGILGSTQGETILLDHDAAGYGWFIDPTPRLDEEFTIVAAEGLQAAEGTAAAGAFDLLSVLAHELGHLQGADDLFGDGEADDLMSARLSPGVRRSQALAALDAFFAGQA